MILVPQTHGRRAIASRHICPVNRSSQKLQRKSSASGESTVTCPSTVAPQLLLSFRDRGQPYSSKARFEKKYRREMWLSSPLVVALLVCLGHSEVRAGSARVTLPDGSVLQSTTSSRYLGIPYGLAARWQPSRLHPPLGLFNASSFGCACPQTVSPSLEFPPGLCLSEKCLTLNVWRPSDMPPNNASLPVFFWVHGGAFLLGGER